MGGAESGAQSHAQVCTHLAQSRTQVCTQVRTRPRRPACRSGRSSGDSPGAAQASPRLDERSYIAIFLCLFCGMATLPPTLASSTHRGDGDDHAPIRAGRNRPPSRAPHRPWGRRPSRPPARDPCLRGDRDRPPPIRAPLVARGVGGLPPPWLWNLTGRGKLRTTTQLAVLR